MREDKRLKRFLVLQSFCPLFILVLIKHIGHFGLILCFARLIIHADWSAIEKAMANPALGDVLISLMCSIWIIMTIIVAAGFRDLQNSNFESYGETISIESEKKDSGVTFLVTFVLPLLVEDVSELRDFIFFIVLLCMVIVLLMRSDLFYQNPVLAAMKYRTYEFQFKTPYQNVETNKTYIGLSKGTLPNPNSAIKRKYIADGVFLIYNE